MMQVSAAVRLIPKPPALVQSRKTKRSESGLQKRSMAACRWFPRTRPSMRSYEYLERRLQLPYRPFPVCHPHPFLPSLDEVILQDVQAADHLREDQDFVSTSQQLWEQLIYEHQFTSRLDHGLQLEVYSVRAVALPETFQNLLLST